MADEHNKRDHRLVVSSQPALFRRFKTEMQLLVASYADVLTSASSVDA